MYYCTCITFFVGDFTDIRVRRTSPRPDRPATMRRAIVARAAAVVARVGTTTTAAAAAVATASPTVAATALIMPTAYGVAVGREAAAAAVERVAAAVADVA